MFLLIDNYDSFTYNLVHYMQELSAEICVHRHDAISVGEIAALNPTGIIISPGPGTPNDAGICLELVKELGSTIPMFGVCLGHQTIAQAFGGKIIRANELMHGKTSPIEHDSKSVFAGLPSPFTATRYHSLVADPATMPECLHITAQVADGTIMGLMHKTLPLHGVQFHPESIASQHGHAMLKNFMDISYARTQ